VLAFLVVWFGINLIFGIGSLAIAPMARALPGRRISVASSQGLCCSRCSIPCRGSTAMLQVLCDRLARRGDLIHHPSSQEDATGLTCPLAAVRPRKAKQSRESRANKISASSLFGTRK
jgi:hypothetical protein